MTIPSNLRVDFTDGVTNLHYGDDHNLEFAKVNTLIAHVGTSVQPMGLLEMAASTYTDPEDLTGISNVVLTLDGNVGALAFTWPDIAIVDVLVLQDGTGGRSITSWTDVTWEGGDAPIIDTTASAGTSVTLITTNGGTSIRGFHGQGQSEARWSTANGVSLTTLTNIPDHIIVNAIRILYVVAFVRTAPTGASIILDLNWNGTTIYSTQANRPTIAAGATQSSVTLPDTVALVPAGGTPGRLGIDVDQIGSTVAGAGLSVLVKYLELS